MNGVCITNGASLHKQSLLGIFQQTGLVGKVRYCCWYVVSVVATVVIAFSTRTPKRVQELVNRDGYLLGCLPI